MLVFLRTCSACSASEERLWVDSYTGTELCQECLSAVINRSTHSPVSEGDNLAHLLAELEDA